MAEKGTGLFLGGTEIQLIQNNKFALVDPSPSTFNIEYLVYAAGGTGGNRLTYDGGGGGAGGLLSGSAEIYTQNYYQITPGSFTGLGINEIALTGGNGGGGNSIAGSTGGSGGGGGGNAGISGSGTVGQGNNGATSTTTQGGGGGGAGSAGSNRDGGSGLLSSINGTSLTYCAGGSGGSNGGTIQLRGNGGYGGSSVVTDGGAGGVGGVIIRYLGPQKANGGTVTADGDYIIHTFDNTSAAFITTTFEEPANPYQFRTDAYSSSLLLAIPGSEFSTLGMSNYYDDVSAGVKGSGTNLTANPSGSAADFNAYANTEFASEDYTTSIFLKDSGGWGTLSNTELNFGTNSFVVEGYVQMTERFTKPPFWKVAIGGIPESDRISLGFPGTGTTDMRGRMIINNTQYFSSNLNIAYNLNQWYHVAWVRSGTSLYYYFNGTQYSMGTSSQNFDVATMGIMRGLSDLNDGAAGAWQDFRVYIGTDKGYTTSTISAPASIIEKV